MVLTDTLYAVQYVVSTVSVQYMSMGVYKVNVRYYILHNIM